MTINKTKTVDVTVFAKATATYTFTDIESHDELDDLGADEFHYSVEGKDEMVFVNKKLLLALVSLGQTTQATR
ncbi:MAG: hypothetical protein RPS47_12680 [Colwellia sp.]|jgi:hypothetical protein